jgi:hypothetical protein
MPRKPKRLDVTYWHDVSYDIFARSEDAKVAKDLYRREPALQAIITVLHNERPSARGGTDGQFTAGYEHCLNLLVRCVRGEVDLAPEPEPNYASPEITEELAWNPQKPL